MHTYQHPLRRLLPLAILSVGLLPACSDDFLDTEPLNSISSEATWSDGALSEAFVFNVYSFLGRGGFDEQMLASLTDEAMFTHSGRNINTFTEGSEDANNLAWTSYTYNYPDMYLAIRQANIALQELPASTFTDQGLRDGLTGEAHFLRAYYYHQLARYYGGVPLVATPYGLDEDYTVARASWEETINFILTDLDEAIRLLDGKAITPGRASMLAAMALKARVLLYTASDLHHGPTASAASATLAESGNLELLAYAGGDREARWRAARDAAKAVIDQTDGYKFDLDAPVSAEEGQANYVSIAMGGASAVGDAAATSELIFERSTSPDLSETLFGMYNGPNGYHNWAGNTPIGQLVDDYEMMDGTAFDWSDAETAAAPYTDRDPRFYASIMYDGADWKPRPSDVEGLEPYDEIQTGFYDDGSGGTVNGIDTRKSPVEDWNGSRTHYYIRKFIDPDPNVGDNLSNPLIIPWPFIRYTEMVLNYVEASIELGEEDEARSWLNRIRFRAGMPAIDDTGDALRDRYRNERRIELAYEEHRYHDVRRWLIAEETQGQLIETIDIRADLKPGQQPRVPYKYDPTVYDYQYSVVENTENETRRWVDKMFYRPIDRDELNRNPALVQNPGY